MKMEESATPIYLGCPREHYKESLAPISFFAKSQRDGLHEAVEDLPYVSIAFCFTCTHTHAHTHTQDNFVERDF